MRNEYLPNTCIYYMYFILIGYSILIQIRLDQQMIPIRILYISLHILKIDSWFHDGSGQWMSSNPIYVRKYEEMSTTFSYNTCSHPRVQACMYPRISSNLSKTKTQIKRRVSSLHATILNILSTRTFFSFVLVWQVPKGFCLFMCMPSLYRWILVLR